ncbi:MAG: hypothetical protein NC314_01145 [Roseburia sp.]|nr:hypothetical protein [Roseburia sp.]MCM1241419.1 hypothetical protein [Roseburia sp.]
MERNGTGFHRECDGRRIGSALLLLGAVMLLAWSHKGTGAEPVRESNSLQELDQESYLRKIWVVQDWNGIDGGGDYSGRASFRITEMDEDMIRGKFATGTLAEPPLYGGDNVSAENIGDFEGVIRLDKAYCVFSDAAGNEGSFIITFRENALVEASVAYSQKAGQPYTKDARGGTWTFRPYCMQDILDMDAGEMSCFKSDYLYGPYWRGGQLTYAVVTDETTHVDSFITDDMNNIWYHFPLDYPQDADYCKIKAVYENKDDLQDIRIRCYGIGGFMEHTLIQQEDGTFYIEETDDAVQIADQEPGQQQSILYTIDETQKMTLVSDDGGIYVEIPCFQEFSHVYITEEDGKNYLHMSNDTSYDQMEYKLVAGQDIEDADEAELFGLKGHFNGQYRLGEVGCMTIEGLEVFYQLCYHGIDSGQRKWHYIIWADLGCGQILRADILQGMIGAGKQEETSGKEYAAEPLAKPLAINGVLEALFSNIEVYTADGEPVEAAE